MHTSIIATIGPSSLNEETLSYFRDHSVTIARLNFSHGTTQWHRDAHIMCKKFGFMTMFDLAGPKILVGDLSHTIDVAVGKKIAFERATSEQHYPYTIQLNGESMLMFSCQFDIHAFVKPGMSMYIDDGKIKLTVDYVDGHQVVCTVQNGGVIKSNKGINIPGCDPDIEFLVERDRNMLTNLLVECKPDILAVSFIRYAKDLSVIDTFVHSLLDAAGVTNYKPLICSKIEQLQAVTPPHFNDIVNKSDIVMIARGDLALETEPVHVMVPFYQDMIAHTCTKLGKPFIIATQMLESMITSPVPTRAEVSDVYRAVMINKAPYIMLSAETAAGKYPRESVHIMHQIASLRSTFEEKNEDTRYDKKLVKIQDSTSITATTKQSTHQSI